MMSATPESEEESLSSTPSGTEKCHSIASLGSHRYESTSPIAPQAELLNRKLGSNETFAYNCNNLGNLNIVCGLTLLTRTSIDEGN